MYTSLLVLSKLRFLAQCRKMKRSLSSVKGIALALVAVGFFGMMLAPAVLSPRIPREAFAPLVQFVFHPAALFAFWLVTLVGSRVKSPISFTMAEIEFLFAGPFTRRQLLVHKLLIGTLGAMGLAAITPLAFPFVKWLPAVSGVFLMTVFMQWTAIVGALAVGWIGARFRLLRYAVGAALVAAALISFWQAGVFDGPLEARERLPALEASWAGRIVLAPFVVFSRLITAETPAAMLRFSGVAVAMDALVAMAILALDHQFLEASLAASRRRYESMQRLKRSGGASAFRLRSRPRFSLPLFPRLGGAGSIAWRQGTDILRSSGGPLVALSVPAVAALFGALTTVIVRRQEPPPAAVIVGVTLFVGFMITTSLPLGLRAELDHVDVTKSLPIRSRAIVGGSLAVACLYIAALQVITACGAAAILGQWNPGVPLALALALPLNLVTVAFDSVLVVLFPSIRRFVPGDLLVGMRMVLVGLAKMLFTLAAAGIAGLPVIAALLLVGESWPLLVAIGCAVLLVEGLGVAWVAALLLEHFDPSADPVESE